MSRKLENVNLDKTIEKILSKIKKEKKERIPEEKPSGIITPSMPEKVYFKALPLRSIEDVDLFKQEVESGNILIVKVSPLAKKSIDDVKRAVSELREFTESVGGNIARLGEERIVITPPSVKIWRDTEYPNSGSLP